MTRRRVATLVIAAAVVAGGIGAGIAFAVTRTSTSAPAPRSTEGPDYSYYQSMMGQFGSDTMMGGSSYGWMMNQSGYTWIMGGASTTPGWMNGGSLPGFMMGPSSDPGQVMGRLFADAPGPRVSSDEATSLGNATPSGAVVDRGANRVTLIGRNVQLTMLASPSGNPDETFRVAGLVNPTITVLHGATVTIQLVNADNDTAHGVVVATSGSASSWMPMMTVRPAFSGAALWFLGDPTSAGMHSGTITFVATTPGTYEYLCPVPGHAQKGMVGTFVVTD